MNPYIFFILQQIFFIPLKLKLISIENENFPFNSVDRHQANVSIITCNLSLLFSVIFEFAYVLKRNILVGRVVAYPRTGSKCFLCSSPSHLFGA